jgi:hypothetical protein
MYENIYENHEFLFLCAMNKCPFSTSSAFLFDGTGTESRALAKNIAEWSTKNFDFFIHILYSERKRGVRHQGNDFCDIYIRGNCEEICFGVNVLTYVCVD